MLELIIPKRCAGCGAGGSVLCPDCQQVFRTPPQRIYCRVDPGVPTFSLGPYAGVRRRVILEMKENANLAVRPYVGAVVRAGRDFLVSRGDLGDAALLVTAPTRRRSARLRGGDHVRDVALATGLAVASPLFYPASMADQVGLDAAERRRNVVGNLQLRDVAKVYGRKVVLVDDVATTGSTLASSADVLTAAGVRVVGALVIAHA